MSNWTLSARLKVCGDLRYVPVKSRIHRGEAKPESRWSRGAKVYKDPARLSPFDIPSRQSKILAYLPPEVAPAKGPAMALGPIIIIAHAP